MDLSANRYFYEVGIPGGKEVQSSQIPWGAVKGAQKFLRGLRGNISLENEHREHLAIETWRNNYPLYTDLIIVNLDEN